MPWDATAPDLGFGSGAAPPWLPLAESHRALAVDRQEADPRSLLHHYRRLLRWRKGQPALIHGEIELLPEHAQVLAFVRSHRDERILCAFNLSESAAELELRAGDAVSRRLDDSGVRGAIVEDTVVRFEPFGVLIARMV